MPSPRDHGGVEASVSISGGGLVDVDDFAAEIAGELGTDTMQALKDRELRVKLKEASRTLEELRSANVHLRREIGETRNEYAAYKEDYRSLAELGDQTSRLILVCLHDMREELLKSFVQHDALQNWFDEYHEREGLDGVEGRGIFGEMNSAQREAFLKILYERINFALSNTLAVHEPGVNTLIKEGVDLASTLSQAEHNSGSVFAVKMGKLKTVFDVAKENKSCQTVAPIHLGVSLEGGNNSSSSASTQNKQRQYGAPPAMGALPVSTNSSANSAAMGALSSGMLPGLQFQARQAKIDMLRHGVHQREGNHRASVASSAGGGSWMGVTPGSSVQAPNTNSIGAGLGVQAPPGAGGARYVSSNFGHRSNFSTPSASSVSPAKRSYRVGATKTPPNSLNKPYGYDNVHPAAMVPALNLSGL